MASTKQRQAAKNNIRKAQKTWRSMSSAARARSQPEGRGRQKPGTTGKGEFYHVEVRPKTEFETFRVQDVGKKHGIERVAGRRGNGSWDTQKWLISKEDAHVEDGELVPDSAAARKVLAALGATPAHVAGDRFKAKPRPNVPEHEKPTRAQRRARKQNIKKAQAAQRG